MKKLSYILDMIFFDTRTILEEKFMKTSTRHNSQVERSLLALLFITLPIFEINEGYAQCSPSTNQTGFGSFDITNNGTDYSAYNRATTFQTAPNTTDIPSSDICWDDDWLEGNPSGPCNGTYTIAESDDGYHDWSSSNPINDGNSTGNIMLINTDGTAATYTVLSNTINVVSGCPYTFSIKFAQLNNWGTTIRTIQLVVDGVVVNSSNQADVCTGCGTPNPGWQTLSYTFTPVSGSVSIQVRLVTDGSTANDWAIDNYYLTGPTPPPLPVEFIFVKASKISDGTFLQWQTVMEVNTSYFEVQKSDDGVNWYSVGSVSASNNSGGDNYEFIDSDIQEGVAYYRLKQVDIDGLFTYSSVVSINYSSDESYLKVIPNIIENGDKIKLYIKNITAITFYDPLGRLFLSENTSMEERQTELKLNHLSSGFYIIKGITSDGAILTEKIIIR